MRQCYSYAAAVLAVLTLTCCNKKYYHNDGDVLDKTIELTAGKKTTTHFLYDETGRLVRLQYIDEENGRVTGNEALLLETSTSGRLKRSYYASEDYNSYYVHNYTYSPGGDSVYVTVSPNLNNLPLYYETVALDNSGRPIRYEINIPSSTGTSFESFVYNTAGDIITSYTGAIVNGIADTTSVLQFTYDVQNNPYQPLGLPYFLATGSLRPLNRHNFLTETVDNTAYSWQHSYNNSSVPVKSVSPAVGSSDKVEIDLFYR